MVALAFEAADLVVLAAVVLALAAVDFALVPVVLGFAAAAFFLAGVAALATFFFRRLLTPYDRLDIFPRLVFLSPFPI